MSKMTLSEELTWRGFVNQTTYKSITALDGAPITFYFGVDPSAPSMQIGNLAAAMMVRRFIAHGHKAVLLIGGATGMIGDPDGKSDERSLKTDDEIAANKQGIVKQYQTIFSGEQFTVVDNYAWFKDMGYIDFLRDIGKHVPMRQMLGRDFVQTRLGEDGAGISYAEFSYVLIQAYDFLHLSQKHGVSLQLCGSDQWGNSIAGVDLIRRITGKEAHVWSAPLIVNKATGKKFGKTEDGAIWLDAAKTPVDQFYQFWLNVDDEGVEDYLKVFTELDKEAVDKVMNDFQADRAGRAAQKSLAYEVTKLVHGAGAAEQAKSSAAKLFGKQDYANFTDNDFEKMNLPLFEFGSDVTLLEVLTRTGLASSNSEGRRLQSEGAIYINNIAVNKDKTNLLPEDFLGNYLVLRRGKNNQVLIRKK